MRVLGWEFCLCGESLTDGVVARWEVVRTNFGRKKAVMQLVRHKVGDQARPFESPIQLFVVSLL